MDKQITDAIMEMLYNKGILTLDELNQFKAASDSAAGTSNINSVVDCIRNIGK